MISFPRLYGIADASFGDPVECARQLFHGGVRLLQVRYKNASARELLWVLEEILRVAPAEAKIIVNDRADVAWLAGAAGVHVGQTDLPVAAVRQMIGQDRIVGLSTHNLGQALEADRLAVDYVAVGPVFATSTKQDTEPVIGLEGLARICKAIHKPVMAIGGIRLENAREVFQTGVDGVAVISDLLRSPDIAARAQAWMKLIRSLPEREPEAPKVHF